MLLRIQALQRQAAQHSCFQQQLQPLITACTAAALAAPIVELRLAKVLRQLFDQVIDRARQATELPGVERAVGTGEPVRIDQTEVMVAPIDRLQVDRVGLEHGLQHPVDQRLSGPVRCGRVRAVQHQRVGRRQGRLDECQPWQLTQQQREQLLADDLTQGRTVAELQGSGAFEIECRSVGTGHVQGLLVDGPEALRERLR
ncbi:hypothetical protein D3C80_1496980 [compost metagenome]